MNNIPKTINTYSLKDPILILEDTKESQDFFRALCKKLGIPCVIAENGEVGLQLIEDNSFSLFIVDLMMPVMDGKTFILKLKEKHPEAIILVQSALNSVDTVIEIMKLGIFDYIIKPIDPELFRKTIRKSIELKTLRDMENDLKQAAALKIRSQLEWMNYKEDRRITGKEYAEIKSIYNLKTSLTQGTGFGSLLTLVDLIKTTKKESGKGYIIDRQIIDLLDLNYETCSAQLKGLNSISTLLEEKFKLETYSSAELITEIPRMLSVIASKLHLKKMKITFPEMKKTCLLNINIDKLSLIIEELIINAYKYSVHGSTINMFSYIKEGYFWISVMNQVNEKPYGGIPHEYEKLVLEPFFRLLPPDETIGNIEKFGIGLGLTVVDNITRKHKGIFIIHDVKNRSAGDARSCVLAEIMIPVASD